MRSSETIFPKLFFTPFQLPELSVKRHHQGTLSLHRFSGYSSYWKLY